jgi:phytoene dehydrogenase-like protein
MKRDVIIVGAGIAGLTAAAFLSKERKEPLLLEQQPRIGGLVNSFKRDGFTYDGGIRATENSGILFPMLKQLGLDLEFKKNIISLGIEDQVITIQSEDDLRIYQDLLTGLYPESKQEILRIVEEISKIMRYMGVQYGIDNPAFLDPKEDREYFLNEVLPWMFKYAITVPKISRYNKPVVPFLERYTQNQAVLDIITQHFFTDTPASFALSYLKIYLDYYYPSGGTGTLPRMLGNYIQDQGGTILTGVKVVSLDPQNKILMDEHDEAYHYQQLIWAADLNTLYNITNISDLTLSKSIHQFSQKKAELTGKIGNNSVFTLYLAVDLPPVYFSDIATAHFFYTPDRSGESAAGPLPHSGSKEEIMAWLTELSRLSTYEISLPVLRDKSLAPPGKTGLVISILFDYRLTKHIQEEGWYEEFKTHLEDLIINALNNTIYPGIKSKVLDRFSSTPLTLERLTGNTQGAITGWAFTNKSIPAVNRLTKIFNAIKTPLPDVYQAGQWTYSPSGLPISILTGKLAADRVTKTK